MLHECSTCTLNYKTSIQVEKLQFGGGGGGGGGPDTLAAQQCMV